MSLFFYGAIETRDDFATVEKWLQTDAARLNWNIVINPPDALEQLQARIFPTEKYATRQFLIFELRNNGSDDTYTQLYAEYGGEQMVQHYREIARLNDFPGATEMDFGESQEVNGIYDVQPFDLPLIVFLREVFKTFPDRNILICLDEGFEQNLKSETVIAYAERLIKIAWKTIAMGYSWPNLRLEYNPILV
jgi:hypothetical protein